MDITDDDLLAKARILLQNRFNVEIPNEQLTLTKVWEVAQLRKVLAGDDETYVPPLFKMSLTVALLKKVTDLVKIPSVPYEFDNDLDRFLATPSIDTIPRNCLSHVINGMILRDCDVYFDTSKRHHQGYFDEFAEMSEERLGRHRAKLDRRYIRKGCREQKPRAQRNYFIPTRLCKHILSLLHGYHTGRCDDGILLTMFGSYSAIRKVLYSKNSVHYNDTYLPKAFRTVLENMSTFSTVIHRKYQIFVSQFDVLNTWVSSLENRHTVAQYLVSADAQHLPDACIPSLVQRVLENKYGDNIDYPDIMMEQCVPGDRSYLNHSDSVTHIPKRRLVYVINGQLGDLLGFTVPNIYFNGVKRPGTYMDIFDDPEEVEDYYTRVTDLDKGYFGTIGGDMSTQKFIDTVYQEQLTFIREPRLGTVPSFYLPYVFTTLLVLKLEIGMTKMLSIERLKDMFPRHSFIQSLRRIFDNFGTHPQNLLFDLPMELRAFWNIRKQYPAFTFKILTTYLSRKDIEQAAIKAQIPTIIRKAYETNKKALKDSPGPNTDGQGRPFRLSLKNLTRPKQEPFAKFTKLGCTKGDKSRTAKFVAAFQIDEETGEARNLLEYLIDVQPSQTWLGLQQCEEALFMKFVELVLTRDDNCIIYNRYNKNYSIPKYDVEHGGWITTIPDINTLGCPDQHHRIFLELYVQVSSTSLHKNYIFIDRKKHTVSLFEPHGSCAEWYPEVVTAVKNMLPREYETNDVRCVCGINGPQGLGKAYKFYPEKEFGGYCAAWSQLFLCLQLANPHIPMEKFMDFQSLGLDKLRPYSTYRSTWENFQFGVLHLMQQFVGMLEQMIPQMCQLLRYDDVEKYLDSHLEKCNK